MTRIALDYQPEAAYSYTPKQYRDTWTEFDPYAGTNIEHLEAAVDGTAYSSIRTTRKQAGCSAAGVGAYWELNLPSRGLYSNWDNVKNRPCNIYMKVSSYDIAARGNEYTFASAYWGPYLWDSWDTQVTVHGNDPEPAKSATMTTTWEGTMEDLFSQTGLGRLVFVGAGVQSIQHTRAAGRASASLFCSRIMFEFL